MTAEPIHILGQGSLHRAISQRLARTAARVEHLSDAERMPANGLVVAIHDDWRGPRDMAVQRAVRASRTRLLHIRFDGPLGLIGPTVLPDGPGCLACAEQRRRAVARLPATDLRAVHPGAEHLAPFVHAVADIAVHLLEAGQDLVSRVFVVQARTLLGQWHRFVPVPTCGECGDAPDDGPRRDLFERRDIAMAMPESLRERDLPLNRTLRHHLLDWRYGVVPHTFRVQGDTPLAMCGAAFVMSNGARDAGWGRATTYERAETIAFLEALERYASIQPRGKRLVVRDTLAQLGERALDPRLLGTPDPEAARLLPASWKPFTVDLTVGWVWGYSFARREPILVPAQSVFYGVLPGENNRFVHENSNGAASGASVQEAILYGIFELIERDAFLLTWYGQLPIREIAVDDARDPEVGLLMDMAQAHGYQVRLFDMTLDLEVTSVWGMAIANGAGRGKAFCAAGAHPDPDRAVLSALREVVPDALLYERADEHTDDALRDMLAHGHKVRSLDDHVALYTLDQAFERFSFLLSPKECVPLAAVAPDWRERWLGPTVDASLHALVEHVLERGLDVIAVDLTAPEQRALGQHTVKVLIPGTLPMTFGAAWRRTAGLPRLLDVPVRLGYWPEARRYEDLPFHPHPFP